MSTRKRQETGFRGAVTGGLPVEEVSTSDDLQAWRDSIVTDAEMDAWAAQAQGRRDSSGEAVLRLIGEVRRLQEALRGVDQSTAIVRDPQRCAGDPTIEGTRTAVHDVVSYAQSFNGDLERVRDEALPHLSMKQVRAAMGYYTEHTEEIEEILRQVDEDYARTPLAPTHG